MAVTINADTSNGLVLTPDTSGDIKLQSAGADIATVSSSGITMASGKSVSADNISSTQPAFSATMSASVSCPNNTWTKLVFNTEEYDTDSCFDSSTNYRFTPTVAGYYQITASAFISTSTSYRPVVSIWKNGSEYKTICFVGTSSSGGNNGVITSLVYFNGSTDYVEAYGNQNSGSTVSFANSSLVTFFQGHLVRTA